MRKRIVRKTPGRARLYARDRRFIKLMKDPHSLAEAISIVFRNPVCKKEILENIFQPVKLEIGAQVEYPLDLN